mmetsp:Transcript_8384/g.18350  ORF Transcript_8384/g.18350 Transcript_8384/m.18350 type:complete len:130 (-) Transcript_8384:68-457(-)
MFSQKCLRLVETALSDKYDGLKSEYHLYIHMLRPCFVRYLQEGGIVRRGELVKIEESGGDAQLDPKTLWWSWVAYNTEDEIKSYLETISKDAGIAEDLPWEKKGKFGTPAESIRSQMEGALAYLDFALI